jgi:hypothetical protein
MHVVGRTARKSWLSIVLVALVAFDTWSTASSGWRPTREQVRRFRGDYLGMFAEDGATWFTAQYCGQDAAKRQAIRRETRARGYTHLLITWALRYRDYPAFNWADEPERFKACLDELLADRLVPVVSVSQTEEVGVRPPPDRVRDTWRRIVAVVGCDRVPAQIHGWEWNDSLTLESMRAVSAMAVETCPDAYHLLHFAPDRWAASPVKPGDQGGRDPWEGSEARFWHDMQRLGVDGLFFQSGERDDLAAFKTRLEQLALRLQGGGPPSYKGLALDLIAGEYCDPHNPQRRSGKDEAWCRDMGKLALTVPGVVGFLNGGPGNPAS